MNISKVGVVGCGLMGSGIAEIAAKSGFEVMVREVSDEFLEVGQKRIRKSMDRAVDKEKLTAEDRDAVGGRRAPVHRREALLETSLGCDDGIDLGAHAHLLKEEFAVCCLKGSPELVELLADETESGWSAQRPDRRRGRLRCRPFRFRLSGFEHTRAFLLRSTAALSRVAGCAEILLKC